MANGETYQVTTQEHYHLQKRSDDAAPPPLSSSTPLSSAGSGLVIFRDSDLYTRSSNILRRKRGLAPEGDSSCGSEILFDRSRRAEAEAEAGVVGAEPKPLIHEYYYPPNLTTYIPDLSSSWSDVWKTGSLRKRDVAINVAGPNPVPDGCPTSRLVNYMGVAADCTYVRNYKGSANARKQIFSTFNTVSAIYESTFNVALGIIALNIVPDGCPSTPVEDAKWNQDCSDSYSIDLRLSDFSNWRGQGDRSRDGAGLWHLMTTCKSGPVVGIAWTKALCQAKTQTQNTDGKQQYTAGAAVSSAGPQEWMVVAHEIGHNFGAVHDCNQQTCTADKAAGSCCPLSSSTCDAGAKYIMNPSESTPTKIFSPCSIKAICHTLKSGAGQCLKPPGTRVTHSSEPNICGNGLKEEGEECDCGSPEDCAKDPCCDGTTCKLKNGAVCDDLNDGCCLNCQMRPQGHVCRPAISECDIQEVCSGTNASCPSDERVPNLTPCKGSKNETGLQCANGLCTSRDLQCKQQDKHGKFKQCSASNTCELTCNDPSGSALSCIQVQGTYFVDGSPCGFGGTCNAGTCEYTGGVNSVLDWIKGNLLIFVPVAAIVGLFFLCCIWSCCCAGCYNRRRQQRLQGKPQRLNSTGYQYSSFAPPPGNPPGYPPPQQYPMAPMGSMVPPTPSYQGGYPQQPQPQPTGFTYHSNASSNPNNPFGNHNALPNQQRPQQSGYI
ncbi:Metallo-peptidase family M12-domain-containing protein [Lobosporangium transversale]|uniref:Metallo-peptidase family M12-domain-containing protein n=1 Tax=Lobosporangium transversale TaxID=64571 RepID=A0A1Y2G5N5_9FUNG|nr:Metallo-peptidase family M12-domain-containing protein [Lobosporangium transversale]ORY96016.1 Metallo-peptidase family M12-domain-containing protein [Lobosporangium transversale]|eukprot:XP_021875453.1 Metallo-peptidase family M12-domain-containing protein [Lobosporangium transversale]